MDTKQLEAVPHEFWNAPRMMYEIPPTIRTELQSAKLSIVKGDLNYRKACAKYMKREYDVELDPETEISSTIGSKEAIFHFPIGFTDPGDIVICPTPAFPVYKIGTQSKYPCKSWHECRLGT